MNMKVSWLAVILLLFVSLPLPAQTTDAAALQKQIDALREGQNAILKELQDIRRLLQSSAPGEAPLPAAVDISREPFKGLPAAKVAIIEFSDFECPFCGRYDRDTFPQIESEYVKSGKVKYVWRDLPLSMHKNAFKAAEAAHCAGEQGKFWEMHDRFFDNQKALTPADVTGHAAAVGLDAAAFQQCLDSGRHTAGIRKDMGEAASSGITGTPSFLIGIVQPDSTVKVVRRLIGARPLEDFKQAIDEALTAASR
jgi:protein-disulfide isomerase